MSGKQQTDQFALDKFISEAESSVHNRSSPLARLHLCCRQGAFSLLGGLLDGLEILLRSSYRPIPSHDHICLRWLFIFGSVISASFIGVVLCIFSAYLGCLIGERQTMSSVVEAGPDLCNWSLYSGLFIGLSWLLGTAVCRLTYPRHTHRDECS
eukprot:g8910.t1